MTDHAGLRAAILAAVPADGSNIRNQSLYELLSRQFPSLGEEVYWQIRDALIAEGLLAKGRWMWAARLANTPTCLASAAVCP